MTQQLKTLLLFIAAFFIASSLAGPCGPGYVEIPDCMVYATDPAGGNCWWGYATQSCTEIYASTADECADYCGACLACVYNYGCCAEGDPLLYQECYSGCTANL